MSFDLSIESLKLWNRRGIIAGPTENRIKFMLRASSSFELWEPDKNSSIAIGLFDINPTWVEIIYSNVGIGPWEGGCSWISEEGVKIQLRKKFKRSDTFLRLYFKREVLAHELVHAARVFFNEPIFEEIIAYNTSQSKFRRIIGPLFRSQTDIYLFFMSSLLSVGISMWSIELGSFLFLLAPVYFGYRLYSATLAFKRALKKIKSMTGINPLWVILRLTDQEIYRFAYDSDASLYKYINIQKKENIRWQQIYFSYFI